MVPCQLRLIECIYSCLFQLIYKHWMNTLVNYCGPFTSETGYCKRLESYIRDNLQWVQEQMEKESNSAYWHQVFDRHVLDVGSNQERSKWKAGNERFDCPALSSPRCAWHCCSWKAWRTATMNSCPFHSGPSPSIHLASCKEKKVNLYIIKKKYI